MMTIVIVIVNITPLVLCEDKSFATPLLASLYNPSSFKCYKNRAISKDMCSLRLPTLKILFCFVFHCNGAIKSYLRKKEPRTLAS